MDVDKLLSIYRKAYKHHENSEAYEDYEHEISKKLAFFAYLITTEPESKKTKDIALMYETQIDDYHSSIIEKMEGILCHNYKDYKCKCIEEYITERLNQLEKKLDTLENEDTDEYKTLVSEYEKWLQY